MCLYIQYIFKVYNSSDNGKNSAWQVLYGCTYELSKTVYIISKSVQVNNNFYSQREAEKEEEKKTETKKEETATDTEDKNRAMSEDEGGLVQKMFTALNNAGVVSVSHGIKPPGVSQWPVGPVLRLGPGGRDREERTGTERSFLSHILLDRHVGLAFPLAFTLVGRLCSLTGMLGN